MVKTPQGFFCLFVFSACICLWRTLQPVQSQYKQYKPADLPQEPAASQRQCQIDGFAHPAPLRKYLCHQAEVAEDAQAAWSVGELERALDPVPNTPLPKHIPLFLPSG